MTRKAGAPTQKRIARVARGPIALLRTCEEELAQFKAKALRDHDDSVACRAHIAALESEVASKREIIDELSRQVVGQQPPPAAPPVELEQLAVAAEHYYGRAVELEGKLEECQHRLAGCQLAGSGSRPMTQEQAARFKAHLAATPLRSVCSVIEVINRFNETA